MIRELSVKRISISSFVAADHLAAMDRSKEIVCRQQAAKNTYHFKYGRRAILAERDHWVKLLLIPLCIYICYTRYQIGSFFYDVDGGAHL